MPEPQNQKKKAKEEMGRRDKGQAAETARVEVNLSCLAWAQQHGSIADTTKLYSLIPVD